VLPLGKSTQTSGVIGRVYPPLYIITGSQSPSAPFRNRVMGQFEMLTRSGTLPAMLFMVLERFRGGDPRPVGERFKHSGRMLPDGVTYHVSWVDVAGARCFQVMEAPHAELLDVWVSRWNDLIDFEIVPVQTSSDFWSDMQRPGQSK